MKRRDHTLPFKLTPHETELLALWDAFAAEYHQSRHEFMRALTGKNVSACAIYVAEEKRRTQQRWEAEQQHAGTSSLSKARGHERMEGTK